MLANEPGSPDLWHGNSAGTALDWMILLSKVRPVYDPLSSGVPGSLDITNEHT